MDKDGKKVAGQIVVSREQVFDAIDEWHQGHAHMGQERTWTYCWSKYFNVTQQLVRIYCKMCVACSKKNPVGNAPKGSRKPIMLLNWQSRFELDLMDFCKLRKGTHFVCSCIGFLLSRIMPYPWCIYARCQGRE